MKLTSSAFTDNNLISSKYAYKNENISPPLSWSNFPENTKTFAIIVDDPDARDWSHWIIFNIPHNITSLSEGISKNESLKNGAIQGINDFKKIGYDGPSPPSGTHRYVFHLYALDTELDLDSFATKQNLLDAIDGHILEETKLTGKFSK